MKNRRTAGFQEKGIRAAPAARPVEGSRVEYLFLPLPHPPGRRAGCSPH